MVIVSSSIVYIYILEGIYELSMSMRFFTLIMSKIFIEALKIMRRVAMATI